MDKDKVPQDDANMLEGKFKVIKYAVDKDGKYTTVPSVGWEPENVALEQAWEVVKEDVDAARKKVENGELSPLAFHMAKNMMDPKLLAKYIGFSSGKVRDHLKPESFSKLSQETLKKYADVFNITPEKLLKVDDES